MVRGSPGPNLVDAHLVITLDSGDTYRISLQQGRSLEDELRSFRERGGRYGEDWIPVEPLSAVTETTIYVRYDRIRSVTAALV